MTNGQVNNDSTEATQRAESDDGLVLKVEDVSRTIGSNAYQTLVVVNN